MPNVSCGSINVATVLDYISVAINGSITFSSKSFSGLSVMTDFFFSATFYKTYEALFFLKPVKTSRASPCFPKLVPTDLDTLDQGLIFFRYEWLDFTEGEDFLGPPICSVGTEKGNTSAFCVDGGSWLALVNFGRFGDDWIS